MTEGVARKETIELTAAALSISLPEAEAIIAIELGETDGDVVLIYEEGNEIKRHPSHIDDMPDEGKATERSDGPTPNGGAYSIAYYHADGSMEIVEFDAADVAIHRSYSAPNESDLAWAGFLDRSF